MDISDLIGPSGNGTDLPKPNVAIRTADDDGKWTAEHVAGIICNPIYAGIGPYPPLVDEKTWVRTAATAIDSDGKEQFLVNLLYLLRQDFENAELIF